MAIEIINVGASANDGNGDPIRDAFIKCNDNFDELETTKISGSGTDNYVPKFNGTDAIENSQIFDNGSGVGINTTSPNYTTSGRGVMDINGSSQSLLSLSVGGVGKSFLFYTGTDLLVSNESNGSIKFNTNGSEKAIITSTGNVGIGTGSPIGKLDVTGTNGTIRIESGGNSIAFLRDAENYISAKGGTSSSLIFETGLAERMRITSSGNVGIGTTSPSAKLDVTGGNIHSYYTYVGNGENYNIRLKNDLSGDNGYLAQLGGTTSLLNNAYYASAGQYKATSTTSSSISLESGNVIFNAQSGLTSGSNFSLSERMRITSGGNVGIGTSSPSKKLTVIDNTTYQLRLASTNSAYSDAGIFLGSDVSDPFYFGTLKWNQSDQVLRMSSNSASGIGGITFETSPNTSAPSERMRITSSGNVGIGTTSPSSSAILHLKSNSKGFLPPTMSTSERNSIGGPENGLIIYNTDSETIEVYTTAGWKSLLYI